MNKIKSRCRYRYDIILLLIFVLVLLPIVFAQSGEIRGKIFPLDSNATIYVISPTQEVAGIGTISINGEYSFKLPIGIYDLFIRARGEYNNKTIFQIGVKENETTELQDITLSRFNETGSISGYVNPVIDGIKVEIKKFGSVEFYDSTFIDEYGSYVFKNLEPDTYGLFVRFGRNQDFYNYKWGMIDINANANLSGVNLTFTPKNSSYLIDRIIVEFQPTISENEKKNIINSFNSKIISHYSYSRNYVVSVPSSKTVYEMVNLFKTNSNVIDAHLDRILSVRSGAESSEDRQIEEERVSAEEFKKKIIGMETTIKQKISESKDSIVGIEESFKNKEETGGNLDISGKNKLVYIILTLLVVTIIFISYLMIKWKKRVLR